MARTVHLGGRTFTIKAGPLSLFYFHEEFGSSIMEDYARMFATSPEEAAEKSFYELLAQYDWPSALRLAWAFEKTASSDPDFPIWEAWIAAFDYIDMGDNEFIVQVGEEATRGLFRTRDQAQKQEERKEST